MIRLFSCFRSAGRQTPRYILAWILSILITNVEVRAQSSARVIADSFDRATLVVLAPQGPILADLRISVSRRPFRQWVGEFLARQLDQNRSGTLDREELGQLADNTLALLQNPSVTEILRDASTTQDSDQLSVAEFAAWVRQRIPRAFEVIAEPAAADDAVPVSVLIDLDQDAAVSNAELQQALRTLRFHDLDDDQTFTIAELMPYRDPRSQDASLIPEVASLPFVQITDADSLTRAAQRVIAKYGHDGTIAANLLRLPDAKADASVASLTEAEVRRQLMVPQFHLIIDVGLSDAANRSQVDVQVASSAQAFCQVHDTAAGSVRLTLDGMPLTISARGGSANNRSFTKGFLGQNFLMTDADRSQYLDQEEFAAFSAFLAQSGMTAQFEQMDSNKDLMIQRDEMFAFITREQAASQSRIEVSVRQEGKNLFSLLDINGDRRLSPRELRDGFSAIASYDLNEDGELADSELGTEYQLTIGLGRTEARRSSMQPSAMMQRNGMTNRDAILPDGTVRGGPEWFRRMDRNQDGDVALREFL
ncbi:MAG: hypothetical protein KDA96_26160, partial [Planctomycetaceae bacterium]|nr:hypothetical protein [Planctomycetaceae bacterium]